MIVLPCPSRHLLLSLLSKMNPWPHCLLTVAPKRGPSSSIVHEHCPCPFLFLFVTLAVGILSAVPKGSREEAGEHERGDIPSVTRVIFPVCSYSEVQTFPFSNPPTAQSPFFSLLAKHPLQPTNDSHVGHLLKGLNWWLFVPCVTGWCWFPNSLKVVQSGWCQPSAAGSDATAPSLPLKLWMQLTKIFWCAHGSPDELSSSQNLICAWQSSGKKKIQ